jgi:hypothetical protein
VVLLRSCAPIALLLRSARCAAVGAGAGAEDPMSCPGRLGAMWSLPRSRSSRAVVGRCSAALVCRRWRMPSLSLRTRTATVDAASAAEAIAVAGRQRDRLSSRSHGAEALG